jgi:hypothetical protein
MQSGLKSLPQKASQIGCAWEAFAGAISVAANAAMVFRLRERSRLKPLLQYIRSAIR